MTAEISILNRQGVALAADSAVTIGGGQKIFTTVNKIFCLSQNHPIGFMIYGRADFMGIPLETIISLYRDKLGVAKFKTLEEYSDDFLSFLSGNLDLFPQDVQKNYFYSTAFSFVSDVERRLKDEIKNEIDKKGSIGYREISLIFENMVIRFEGTWAKKSYIKGVNSKIAKKFLGDHRKNLEDIIDSHFKKLRVQRKLKDRLVVILAELALREVFNQSNLSGVVIAGFGEKDFFSSMCSLHLEAIYSGIFKYETQGIAKINRSNGAVIAPFAQREMVGSFMEGIHPEMHNHSSAEREKILHKIKLLVDDNTFEEIKGYFKEHDQSVDNFKEENFSSPTVDVVAILPKEELAMMAETLVNLTSFKRKISMDAESVGGPIDVAVISKNDGFVWIKHKSYYKSELNNNKK